jgi:hypothetical protein
MILNSARARYVDYFSSSESLWRCILSIDFGVVVEGEMKLELEGGEKRLFERGDIAVQHRTNISVQR